MIGRMKICYLCMIKLKHNFVMRKTLLKIIGILSLFIFYSNIYAQNRTIHLEGEWRFDADAGDRGEMESWFAKQLKDHIILPGSMTENGKGDEVTLHTQWTASIYDSTFFFNPRMEKYRRQDNLKLPFWLTPNKYYAGAAWYQKDVTIPADWKNSRIVLFLERPHTETRLWINNKEVGMQNSLSVPHVFEISRYLKTGLNTITIRVDNRTKDIDVGKDSHSITDQTQGNWNGIVGKIELQSMPLTYIDDVQVYPDLKNKKALVKICIEGGASGTISLEASSFNSDKLHRVAPVSQSFTAKNKSTALTIDLPMGDDFLLWDEFNPNLYKLTVKLKTNQGLDTREIQFGMREFTIEGKYFYINGRKTMLRGTVENCVFPLTGYAPMDLESWIRVFRICRSFGLNHIRFHSYCPPEAAMKAADLTGFYLQPEGPSWPNHGTSLGDGLPVDNYLWEEAQKIVRQYGNNPSFCMFAIGNEPRGHWVEWVSRFVDYWKETDSRRVYTGASVGNGWAWQPENQYHVKAGARGLNWDKKPESLSDYRSRIDTVKQPYVSHETGQWCVFPDFTEIDKYTGVMRARNFELFREDLKDHNMGDLSAEFLKASGKLQAFCYKHEIEKTLRTPGYAGFQLLSLNDYSGQGTALVGVLNAFWEEKGYIHADEFRKFCDSTVLLARMDKFVFQNNESLAASIEVAHFGQKPLENTTLQWRITDAVGSIITHGQLEVGTVDIGNCQQLGVINFPLNSIEKAQKLNLEVYLDHTGISNNWDFWVYPASLPQIDAADIYITDKIDSKTKDQLDKGGKVLLLLAGKVEQGKDVVQYMTPSFWNTSWFKMRPPHTEGTLINNYHPVFKDFPTDYYTGLQWWELIYKAQAMEMTNFPASFQPIVQPIDTWFINRKLGMLFEAAIGKGKIIVCSADLRNDLENRPVARQLYYSIVKYMASNHFAPEHSLDWPLIEDITNKEGEKINIETKDAPDELKDVDVTDWPVITKESKPWTRWWWMGNDIDSANLRYNLEALAKAGIGGVEITPIYGVKGRENHYIQYLSPQWMNMLAFTEAEASRLNMGVDMNTGTGWPFGGPEITIEDAATKAIFQKYNLKSGQRLKEPISVNDEKQKGIARLNQLIAYSSKGKKTDLTDKVSADGTLDWTAPQGEDFELIALFEGKTLQMVKRAAPGGEGYVLNHFDKEAVMRYLGKYDKAFSLNHTPSPEHFFNDSYEVYGADWTSGLLEQFEKKRGYKLQDYFPELLSDGATEISKRVISDYRETIGDLLKENFTQPWTEWANSHNAQTRNQAHGSPANLLDLYAAVDVPECESFGITDFDIPYLRKDSISKRNDGDPTILKYASSAAHITGKPYTSSETFTWLTEHFRTSLSQCKPEIDQMFTSGVNHVYFHGTTYSPEDAAWPGWKFYASIDMSPTNPYWQDAPVFFNYIAQTQSFLQSGKPDNDFLLYLPMYDIWSEQRGDYYSAFSIHGLRERLPQFCEAVEKITGYGYGLDYISDYYIQNTTVDNGLLKTTGGINYKALILPAVHLIPLETMEQIKKLAEQGATIIFMECYPSDVPGLFRLDERRNSFKGLMKQFSRADDFNKVSVGKLGKGTVITGNDYSEVLAKSGVKEESFISRLGGQLIRRSHEAGHYYFFTMLKNNPVDGWVSLAVKAVSALFFDPMTGNKGQAAVRENNGKTEVYMQLKPGQSIVLKTFADKNIDEQPWIYYQPTGKQMELKDGWTLSFPESEPMVKDTFKLASLVSWTELNNDDLKRNMATACYRITFDFKKEQGNEYRLCLGDVRESARIKVNGKDAGTLIAVPFETNIGSLLKDGENTIEIEVTNLPANRIADYDRRGVEWRIFKDINFVSITYQNTRFDTWGTVPSGLLGPVGIQEFKHFKP